MCMKKAIAILVLFSVALLNAQTGPENRKIITAVPFLLVTSDARAAGMGDMGVATATDVYSQQWNPAKYVFSTTKVGFGFSYTPYLSSIVNDIALLNGTYYNRINERSAWFNSKA